MAGEDIERLRQAALKDPAQTVRLADALVANDRAEEAVHACRTGLQKRPDDVPLGSRSVARCRRPGISRRRKRRCSRPWRASRSRRRAQRRRAGRRRRRSRRRSRACSRWTTRRRRCRRSETASRPRIARRRCVRRSVSRRRRTARRHRHRCRRRPRGRHRRGRRSAMRQISIVRRQPRPRRRRRRRRVLAARVGRRASISAPSPIKLFGSGAESEEEEQARWQSQLFAAVDADPIAARVGRASRARLRVAVGLLGAHHRRHRRRLVLARQAAGQAAGGDGRARRCAHARSDRRRPIWRRATPTPARCASSRACAATSPWWRSPTRGWRPIRAKTPTPPPGRCSSAPSASRSAIPTDDPRADREMRQARALMALERGEACTETNPAEDGDIAARCALQKGDVDGARKILSQTISRRRRWQERAARSWRRARSSSAPATSTPRRRPTARCSRSIRSIRARSSGGR